MSLYRTSRHTDYQFLLEITRSPEEANAIVNAHYNMNDIFHNYLCGLPVDETCITRFGYKLCRQRPLYLCEVRDTTLLEFTYWVLKNSHELEISPIRAYIYEVDMEIKKNIIDLTRHSDCNTIMDLRDTEYKNAHSFVKGLAELPDYIIYPSVRTSDAGSLNYSFFSGEIEKFSIVSILTISKDNKKPKDRVFIVSNDGSINGFYQPVK